MPGAHGPNEGVVFADDALVVFNKPAGLPSVPGRPLELRVCAASLVQALFADALVVHRLDMATSGLLLFARGKENQRLLSHAFATQKVSKTYVAIVHGQLQPEQGHINAPLAADWPRRPRQVVDEAEGKPSHTNWVVNAYDPLTPTTRVTLRPHTGRTHQLRVHMAHVGHPIVGDGLYGPEDDASPRLMLHACELALAHPITGKAMNWNSPVPF